MRRIFTLALVAVLSAAISPLAAQDVVPTDWTYRLDGAQRFAVGDSVRAGEWRYTRMPPGWHLTTTESGVTTLPKDVTIHDRWAIEVELFLFPNPSDQSFGIVVESNDPTGPDGGAVLRFLMRADGQVSAEARHGSEERVLVPWRRDSTLKAHAGGVERHVLRVAHESATIAFAVDGHEVLAIPTGGANPRAVPGLRVGRGLNLHISRFDVITPLAPPRLRGTTGY
jgi:hypothetical protein